MCSGNLKHPSGRKTSFLRDEGGGNLHSHKIIPEFISTSAFFLVCVAVFVQMLSCFISSNCADFERQIVVV